MQQCDDIVVGQGLAGSAAAWMLHLAGRHVVVVDPGESVTSSRIAAGLITPVTGQRLVMSPEFNAQWKLAKLFYGEVEAITQRKLLHRQPAVRVFRSSAERDVFELRRASGEYGDGVRSPQPPLTSAINAPLGAFEMLDGGRLDVPAYLDATRAFFEQCGRYLRTRLDPGRDIELQDKVVVLPSHSWTARRLLFCQGYDRSNPWFGGIRFNPAKGEILTLRIPDLEERRTIHRDIWLARAGDAYRCGSTYDWQHLDSEPTPSGRTQILDSLTRLLGLPIEVVEHRAAVRPTMHDFHPAVGFHPRYPQLGCLNGLGSKGSLLAPSLAKLLLDSRDSRADIPPSIDVQRWLEK